MEEKWLARNGLEVDHCSSLVRNPRSAYIVGTVGNDAFMSNGFYMLKDAILDQSRKYRYVLKRQFHKF